mmetsp:Transcript_15184/g.14770  ORF Transcript_15184/g.14770 Transcript_15184/m.14770 type:complete len:173 (-) Transcript_15184:23-541(-)
MDAEVGATIAAFGSTLEGSIMSIGFSNLAINILFFTSLNMLWGAINALQIIVVMPLFNLDFPSNAYIVFELLAKSVFFDYLPQDKVYFFIDFSNNSASYNQQFEFMGFDTTNFVFNLGDGFVFLLTTVLTIIFVGLISIIKLKSPKMAKRFAKYNKEYVYMVVFRLVVQSYL